MTDQAPCEICHTTAETVSSGGGDYIHQNCPRCGEFKLAGTAASMLRSRRSPEFIAKLSGWVHDHNRGNDVPMISSNVLEEVESSKALSVTQRSQRLLLEAVRGQKKLGERFKINEPRFIAASHSQDKREVGVLLEVLREQDLMKVVAIGGATKVLPKGYTEAEKLKEEAHVLEVVDVSQAHPTAPKVSTASTGNAGGAFSGEFSDEFDKDPSETSEQTEVHEEPFSDGTHISDQTDFDGGATTFDTEDSGTNTGPSNTPPAIGASEFFSDLGILISPALRDLLTIAAAYSRAKKAQQDTISSTCLLFAAADGWQDRVRAPTDAETATLNAILSFIRASHLDEFEALAANIFARTDTFQNPGQAGLRTDDDGLIDFDSFDFSGMSLSLSLKNKIEHSYRISNAIFKDDTVSIAHLLIDIFLGPSSNLASRLAEIGVRPPEIASEIGEAASLKDSNNKNLWENFGNDIIHLEVEPVDLGRAGALSDTIYDSEDKLQFSARANTFAKLIADESLRLPLAIGLFGNWGSGKSFFMNLVKDAIDGITEKSRAPGVEPSTYLPRIAQIEFNAWHYMDTNLWASMAARIFEGLMEELAGPKNNMAADVRARLRTDIQSSKRQIEAVVAEREIAKEQQTKALKKLARMKLEKTKAEEKLGGALLKKLKSETGRSAAIKELEDIARKLGFSGTIQSVRDINTLVTEFENLSGRVGAVWSRFTQFFKTGGSAAGFTAFLAVALIVIFNLGDLLTWVLQDLLNMQGIVNWVSDRVSAPAAELLTALVPAAAWIGTQLKRASDGLAKAQDLRAGIDNLMNSATADSDPLAEAKKELGEAKAKVGEAEQEIKETEYRLEEVAKELQRINAGGLVYDFLAEKLGDSEYTKSLGLISTIREDFRSLDQLMEDWRNSGAIQGLDNSANTHPIKRIVLYIDDLDRCHPDRVVEVLQAVHLLLAYDLFVVVVAVDARWLEQSLYRVYAPERFAATNGDDTSVMLGTVNKFNPHNYLEKIFQIPFSIPGMAPYDFEELMTHLAGEIAPRDIAPEHSAEGSPMEEVEPVAVGASQTGGAESPVAQSPPTTPIEQVPQPQSVFKPIAPVPALLPEEARCLGCMGAFIKTPRLAKRLVNLYRLIRISGMEDATTSTDFMDEQEKPFVAVTLMLAISITNPEVSAAFLSAIRNKSREEGMYDSEIHGGWNFDEILSELIVCLAHIDEAAPYNDVKYIRPLLDIDDTAMLKTFADDLNQTAHSLKQANLDPMPTSVQTFRNWADEVECFSFNW